MQNTILFISTMYPTPLRPGTKVCHYFTRQWKTMGYDVLVIHFRSMFPAIYTISARLLPSLAKKYIGNHVEMDRNMNIEKYYEEGITVYSIPVFKYIPHGKYPKRSIDNAIGQIEEILQEQYYEPDAIIGHFFNPTLEVVGRLKQLHPNAKTCVSLHEQNSVVIKKCYPDNYMDMINGVDFIGYRSVPIKNNFEAMYGNLHKSLLCWSGTPQYFLEQPSNSQRTFSDGRMKKFLYVGQTIKRKYPKETIEGIYKACGDKDFHLTYVGTKDPGYPETKEFIEKNHLENCVCFTGKIPREEIINFYDQGECFILISRDEVFGLVYLEAMSRGCITIAGKGEGMEGIIEHGVNGFLCEPGNAEDLASIICFINSLSADEKRLISDNARRKAAELSDYNVAKYYIDSVMGV